MRRRSLSCARGVFAGIAALAAGCFGNGDRSDATSGSPEADRRAELIVDSSGNVDGENGAEAKTLYQRLGGDQGIAALVDDVTARVIADPRVNFDRSGVRRTWYGGKVTVWEATPDNVARFKRHLAEFISLAAGGPTRYTGRDMRTVHREMRITNAEFDAMLGDLIASMERLGYREAEKEDLVAIVETTRKQVVEKQ